MNHNKRRSPSRLVPFSISQREVRCRLARRGRLSAAISLALVGALGVGLPGQAAAQVFPAVVPLSSLNGTNGFRLDGTNSARSGISVSAAGDINGDGIDDLIVGASGAFFNGGLSGSTYVVFGKRGGFSATIALSSLNGSNGFRLDGVTDDTSGTAVSAAGDVNGDGLDDLIIGAPRASPNGSLSGSSYVVFGDAGGFPATVALSSLDGNTGFRLDGVAAYDKSGRSVSGAGDINGDGIDDLIVGAYSAESSSGRSYVVFGRPNDVAFAAVIALSSLNGSTGFRLDGVAAADYSGRSVSAAGDINGDGIDDLIIGAPNADPIGSYSGSSYVVFGKSTAFASTIALSSLNGTTGFRLDGAAGDRSGRSVSAAGDINGDGIDDLIIGAYRADSNALDSGSSYVVFGKTVAFASTIALSSLNGTNGFRLDGMAEFDSAGSAVSAIGDVNRDGIDDLIISAINADPNGSNSGSSYVLFGKPEGSAFAATIALSSLDGSNGFRLDGVASYDRSGMSVSGAGDINGDGMSDFIIAAPYASPIGPTSGSTYVVFGRRAELVFEDGFE